MISFDPIRSRLSEVKALAPPFPTPEELEGFRRAQDLAFRCVIDIGREIREGWTEQRTAALMDTYLRDHGVRTFFHTSFAWFGAQTRFDSVPKGIWGYWGFLNSRRTFEAGQVVLLDTAPILDGYMADAAFTFSFVPNPELQKLRALLLKFREEIPKLFARPDKKTGDIWHEIDERLQSEGYDNCHQRYPFEAVAHRLHHSRYRRLPGIIGPFSLYSFWSLVSRGFFPEVLGPWHSGNKIGPWAIEPHLGAKGFGAKFEELLVVDAHQARWLTDDVPHLSLPSGFY